MIIYPYLVSFMLLIILKLILIAIIIDNNLLFNRKDLPDFYHLSQKISTHKLHHHLQEPHYYNKGSIRSDPETRRLRQVNWLGLRARNVIANL